VLKSSPDQFSQHADKEPTDCCNSQRDDDDDDFTSGNTAAAFTDLNALGCHW